MHLAGQRRRQCEHSPQGRGSQLCGVGVGSSRQCSGFLLGSRFCHPPVLPVLAEKRSTRAVLHTGANQPNRQQAAMSGQLSPAHTTRHWTGRRVSTGCTPKEKLVGRSALEWLSASENRPIPPRPQLSYCPAVPAPRRSGCCPEGHITRGD